MQKALNRPSFNSYSVKLRCTPKGDEVARRRYDEELKVDAVKWVTENDHTIADDTKGLDITTKRLSSWRGFKV